MIGADRVLPLGLFFFAVALLAHAGLWRVRLPRRHTRALALIFLGGFIGAEIAAAGRWGLSSQARFTLLYLSLAMAYIITYSAIEADSPSLVIVRAIAGAGEAGLPESVLRDCCTDEILIRPRLDDLVRDGLVTHAAEGYALTLKGRRFISIFLFYRRLLGKPAGG